MGKVALMGDGLGLRMSAETFWAFRIGVVVLSVSSVAGAVDFEMPLHGGVVVPTEGDESLAAAGPIVGITPLVRLGRPIALGVLFEHSRLAWQARGGSEFAVPGSSFPDDDGSMQTTLLGGVLRWYVVDVTPVHPYLQLSLGYLEHAQIPDHPDCSVDDGFGGQLALGGDYGFAPWGRIGVSGAVFPFALGMGCNENWYDGKPPDPPFPGLGVALQVGLTTVWHPADGSR